jgi:hypothetical protein
MVTLPPWPVSTVIIIIIIIIYSYVQFFRYKEFYFNIEVLLFVWYLYHEFALGGTDSPGNPDYRPPTPQTVRLTGGLLYLTKWLCNKSADIRSK